MIKLCTMTSVCPDMTLDETIAAMKRHGYVGLEPRIEWKHNQGIELDLDASQRADIKARFASEGLEISCVATGIRMASIDDSRADDIQKLHDVIDFAAELGCPYIRTFGGGPLKPGELWGAVEHAAEGYRQCLQHASERDVVILMETHDVWCNSAHVRAVVETVDHANLKVLWDFLHPLRFCEKPEQTFANLGHLTHHVHAHDATLLEERSKLNICGLGEGEFDHFTPLKLLSEAGYDGCFSVEVIHGVGSEHDADGVMAQYAETFRRYLREIG